MTRLFGKVGITIDDDIHGRGPLVTLPLLIMNQGDRCITLVRNGNPGEETEETDIYRHEAREVAALLLAFADGEP